MKAHRTGDEPAQGMTFEYRRHPGRAASTTAERVARRSWSRRPPSRRRACWRSTSTAKTLTDDEIKRGLRKAHHRRRDRADALRLGVQEQGRAGAARRGHRLPAVAARTSRRSRAIDRERRRRLERQAGDDEPFAALAFKIMTDPFVGPLTFFRVYSGVDEGRATRSTTRPRTRRSASAACCRCTPTSAKRSRKCCAGDIAAAVGLKDVTHRRHAVRPEQGRSSSSR